MNRRIGAALAGVALVAALGGALAFSPALNHAHLLGPPDPALAPSFVYLVEAGGRDLVALDPATDQLAGRLHLDLAASHIALSKSARRLAAIDGVSARIVLVDLAGGEARNLALPFTPSLLTVSADGAALAIVGEASVALIDLASSRLIARAEAPSAPRDLMFSGDGKSLFLAADDTLEIFDAARGLTRRDAPVTASGFTRAPDGRALFLRTPQGVAVLDAASLRPLAQLEGHAGAALWPTATGDYLLLLDGGQKRLTFIHGDNWETGRSFSIPEDATASYSGWFDTVAALPSRSRKNLTIVDLWRQSLAPDIALPAPALPGAVSVDGAKLYLPLEGRAELAVVDLRERRLAQIVALPQPALQAALAGSYGICH